METPVVKSISFNPIGPWPLVAVAGLAVLVLTIWAYRQRLRGTSGRWRWIALTLRLIAILLCLLAMLRPSVIVLQKVKQSATLFVLLDDSRSMKITDEVRGQSRWDVAGRGLEAAKEAAKRLAPGLETRFFRFSTSLSEFKIDAPELPEPDGRQTDMGSSLMEALKQQSGGRIASVVLVGDGANNAGLDPLAAAQHFRNQQVPIMPVGLGSETAGTASRDIAAREVVAGPTVFVKNDLQVRGTLDVRGFPGQSLQVELLVEGEPRPVATGRVEVPDGGEQVVPVRNLKWIPSTPGEKKITLRVKPEEGELVQGNNEISTYVDVLKGGLSVLFLKGANFSWEPKFLIRALDASRDIEADFVEVREAARTGQALIDDAEFAPGHRDVYVLGDIPAANLSDRQHRLLAEAVARGAGLMMLGGRSSFGPGGWASTPIADVLPVAIHPGDAQLEPEGGLKVRPIATALDNYVLRLSPDKAENARIWDDLPNITGANQFGPSKPTASVLARTVELNEPVMVSQDVGAGRAIAFGGETWPWARASEQTQLAHRKFWRQAILWLAHKEDDDETQVKLALDRRRAAVGERIELTVTARDEKGEPIADAQYETTVTRLDPDGKAEPVVLYNQGNSARGFYPIVGAPGEYRVKVAANRGGKAIGEDQARFLVYQDDRELEHPAADHALLRQMAEITGGQFLTPELLDKYLRSLDEEEFTDYESQSERKIWDNWPFFLLFVIVLTLEWWIRKKNGWV